MADRTTDEQIERGLEDARKAAPEIVADLIQFDFEQRLMLVFLSNGRRMVLPLEDLERVADAPREQVERYHLLGDGYAVEWPQLDIAFRITDLREGHYGTKRWMDKLEGRSRTSRSGSKAGGSRKKQRAA